MTASSSAGSPPPVRRAWRFDADLRLLQFLTPPCGEPLHPRSQAARPIPEIIRKYISTSRLYVQYGDWLSSCSTRLGWSETRASGATDQGYLPPRLNWPFAFVASWPSDLLGRHRPSQDKLIDHLSRVASISGNSMPTFGGASSS